MVLLFGGSPAFQSEFICVTLVFHRLFSGMHKGKGLVKDG